MATKRYESMRIMSLEGSVLYKNEGFTATKNGKPDPQAFRGIIDESLDTLKLAEVYARHEDEIGYPYLDGKKRFCRAVVNLSFNRAVKVYESYGNRYVLNGYKVTDEDMEDHVCFCTVGGKPTLIAIDVSYREDSRYAPVEEPLPDALLGKYFKYDAETRSYKRSDKAIPTDVTCQEIREHLYNHGFDIDGIHYVRYKRSAGASRDGRCLFIAEPLYADMMAWSSCDLSADTASDQASWQAYIALTLSSIESTIKLPKKSILIIRDRISRFTENVVCVKENDAHDLRAEEEETEIENVIWDGEALLDASVFFKNGYNDHGMMLLRNRFFKTCAFNTNLQDWFFDNDIEYVSQLAGYTTARDIKDVKLVITESSVKYLKFMPKDMPFEEKCKRFLDALYEGKNNSEFGVVKADHDAPLMHGDMAYTNYQLLNTLKGHEYWCDFFYVEVMTGLRRGEICGLKWQDINFEENKLQVKRSVSVKRGGGLNIGETKTETGVRSIQLPPSVAELLKNRKQTAITEWVFPNFMHPEQPINPNSAYRKLKVILKNAELPLIRFHDLRHTFATHATQGGVDPKTLAGILGHTNASFTLDTYTHVTCDMQKSASAIVGNMMKNIMIKE